MIHQALIEHPDARHIVFTFVCYQAERPEDRIGARRALHNETGRKVGCSFLFRWELDPVVNEIERTLIRGWQRACSRGC